MNLCHCVSILFMHTIRRKQLERNIFLYTLIRIFFKRSYLPLIAVFALTYAKINITQLGLVAGISAAMSLIIEIPSGYISDRIGHKSALIIGSFFVAIAPLGYIASPTFWGILFDPVAFFIGYAFHSGAVQVFLHETLIELKRAKEFSMVTARAQKFGLLGNVVLVATVPLTYSIDPRLPFVFGFCLQLIVLIASILLTPPCIEQKELKVIDKNLFSFFNHLHKTKRILPFFTLGFVTAAYHKLPEYREVYFQDIDVAIWIFGFVVALTSLVAALSMYAVPYVEKRDKRIFYFIDYLFVGLVTIVVGFTQNPIIGIGLFIAIGAYSRFRQVIIHAHLLQESPTEKLKATYLSVFEFFSSFHRIWIPIIFGYIIGLFGVRTGYTVFGILLVMSIGILSLLNVNRTASFKTMKTKYSDRV